MSPPMSTDGPLTSPERVRAVIDTADPVARNLQITLSYHELLIALDRHLGSSLDVNWCAFATWASKQAGSFIRLDDVPPKLRRFLGLDRDPEERRPPRWTPTGLLKSERFLAYARLTAGDVSGDLADGNHLVYRLMAPSFARLLALFRDHTAPDPAAREALLESIPAEPETGDELRRAFASFYDARFEADPKRRAERILLGNLLVGYHEQRRLQEDIDGSLSAPIRNALEDKRRKWFAVPIPTRLRMLGARLVRVALGPWIRRVEAEWKAAATSCLIGLALPTGRLELGDDLPPLPNGAAYPEPLAELTLDELKALLAEIDRTPDSLRGSAAVDWARLADRMNYVADFFRSRQRTRELLDPPFTAEQVAAIHAGRVPGGRL